MGIVPAMIALILGGAVAGIIFFLAFLSGMWWRRFNPMAPVFARSCAEAIRLILGICLFIRIQRHDGEAVRGKKIVAANHGSSLAIPLQYLWMLRAVAVRPIMTLKAEHRRNILGRAIEGGRIGIFINRKREYRQANIEAIRHGIHTFITPNSFVSIFPDGQRPTQERIIADQMKYDAEWLRYTKFPKIGGLQTIVDAFDAPVDIVFLTTAFNRKDERWWHIFGLFGATFHIKAEVQAFSPGQSASNAERLAQMWRRMQEDIAFWKGE